jgi:hypothetical protein
LGRKAKPDGSKRIHKSHNMVYMLIKVNGVWLSEHRYVMEQKLGRKLARNEHVHHKDENTLNNDPDNLELVTPREHLLHHNPGRRPVKPYKQCERCGAYIPQSDGKRYCSEKCRFYATHVTRTCRVCGKKFITYRSIKTKTCSRACASELRRRTTKEKSKKET